MRAEGIIFDCDGTLIDSMEQAFESLNVALVRVGAARLSIAELKQYFGSGADRILARILQSEEKGRAAFDHYMEHQSELAARTQLHKGVRELIESLAHDGVPMAVVTGRHAKDLEVLLRPHRISDFFVTMIADSQIPKSKPAPDGLWVAADQMGIPMDKLLYVGDSIYDIQAARAAGCASVAALWDDFVESDELRAQSPDYSAQVPGQVRHCYLQRFG